MSSGEKTQPMWAVLAVCQCWRLYVGFIGSWSQAFNALSPQTRVAAELSPVHTIATMSKQRSTLSKGRNFNAKLVRHCCRFWQQSLTLLRHCCWCGQGFTHALQPVAPSIRVTTPLGQIIVAIRIANRDWNLTTGSDVQKI